MALQPSIRAALRIIAAAAVLAGASGCEKPVVATGNTASAGGIEFSVADYEVRYLEVSDGSNTYEYPQPALVIPVTLKNVGEGDFTYSPTHATQQMSEAQTPLLYVAPGADEDLPPQNKTMINGVFLSKGTVAGQVTKNQTIKKGDSLTDLLLFEVPTDATKLILSVPPSLHRGKLPVLFPISFQPREPQGPKMHKVGEAVALGDAAFTVTGTEIAYVKTRDKLAGEGYSSEPLLKIKYKIENNGAAPLAYDPAHRAVGGRGAALYGKGATFKRVKFAATTSVDGQRDGNTTVAPGDAVEDFVLFDRPPEGTAELSFEYPAALFGASGLARFTLPYEYSDPPLPKELKKAAPEPDKGG